MSELSTEKEKILRRTVKEQKTSRCFERTRSRENHGFIDFRKEEGANYGSKTSVGKENRPLNRKESLGKPKNSKFFENAPQLPPRGLTA